MTPFQSGITAEGSSAAVFLTLNQRAVTGALQKIKSALSQSTEIQQRVNVKYPDADLHLVVAVGSCFWSQLDSDNRPSELAQFPSMESGAFVAPNTPVDLLVHIRSNRKDINFETVQLVMQAFDGSVDIVEEIEGFRYLDNRDLTGFVDGTENPEGLHREQVAVVGEEDSAFAGGSYIHLQRYVHNMLAWNEQPVKVQEDTIGRTKADNVEYPSAEKALTAHTKRTSLKDDNGASIEILRHSMPYGNAQECGLLFASYCRTPDNFTLMLKSMIEGDGHGHSDHLLKYTRAVTGQSFFAPSLDYLKSLVN